MSVAAPTLPGMTWDYLEYCDAVAVEAAGFAAVVKGVDPDLAVPSCPGWTLAELIKHHGSSERRVEQVVRELRQEPLWAKDVEIGLPEDEAAYAEWFAAGVEPLVTTLRAADPEAPLWTNGVDQHVRYWARRILYEAVVHRADAELALGRQPMIDGRIGAEGIDEFLTNLLCFSWVAERLRQLNRDGESLLLSATDLDVDWLITPEPAGFSSTRGAGPAEVRAAGSAGDLLLLIYGRLQPADERFAVTGDSQLLTDWLEHAAF